MEYEKLIIGPVVTLTEMLLGGHYLEGLKIRRQSTGRSYGSLLRELSGTGAVRNMYRGFLPWGAIQCTKGIPVLFTQASVSHSLNNVGLWNTDTNLAVSGAVAGAVQALFVAPTQRLKSIALTSSHNDVSSWYLAQRIMGDGGCRSLFRGLFPMSVQRAADWMVIFVVSERLKKWVIGAENRNLTLRENMMCGIVAGASSVITIPLEVVVSTTQCSNDNERVKYKHHSSIMFRGVLARIAHSAYHTMFMVGGGLWLSDQYKTRSGRP